jgi:hypothetical protein
MIYKKTRSKQKNAILILIHKSFTCNIDGNEYFIRRNFSRDDNGVLARHSK